MNIKKEKRFVFKKYGRLDYPLNLLSVVFERRVTVEDLPEDWELRLGFILVLLSPQQREILDYYFNKRLSLEGVGNLYGMGRAAARDSIARAVLILKYPCYKNIWKYGFGKDNLLQVKDLEIICTGCDHRNHIVLSSPIFELNLNTRSYYGLKRAKIDTIEQLIRLRRDDLLKIQGLGNGCLDDIEQKLGVHGFSLRD